eukprot:TRINITY_DN10449_c0_g1_i1.p1 TRINITY_DN10449_c0_g1~~TRINITY_DN10449_c0_g1_i1.p1  ORF type:complete len:153 (+),score=36.09 TRINITY_DN10449_c0_g1_i1:154-612(+)
MSAAALQTEGGLYVSVGGDDAPCRFLRFYDDSQCVIAASGPRRSQTQMVASWLHRCGRIPAEGWYRVQPPAEGNARVRERAIAFSLTSATGTVLYQGRAFLRKGRHMLSLRSVSLINGNVTECVFEFVRVPAEKGRADAPRSPERRLIRPCC